VDNSINRISSSNSHQIIQSLKDSFLEQRQKLHDSFDSNSIDNQLNEITLSSEVEHGLRNQHAIKALVSSLTSVLPCIEQIKTLLNWNKEVNEEIREAKKEILLALLFGQNAANSKSLNDLINFMTDPFGNTLFNKILSILDDSPPDIELITQLSNAIKFMLTTDYSSLFSQHKYFLSLMQTLSSQSLVLLCEHIHYPDFTISQGPIGLDDDLRIISSFWTEDFAKAYCEFKEISDSDIVARYNHCINQLVANNCIEAFEKDQQLPQNTCECRLTSLGEELVRYIQVERSSTSINRVGEP